MKFTVALALAALISDPAFAGMTVPVPASVQSGATGTTPATTDNTAKLATTAWGKSAFGALTSYGVFTGFAGTVDTGLSVNVGPGNRTVMAVVSFQTSTGNSTYAALYMLRFHFDGNLAPTATQIAQDIGGTSGGAFVFGVSGSNTLTITPPTSGNWQVALQGNN